MNLMMMKQKANFIHNVNGLSVILHMLYFLLLFRPLVSLLQKHGGALQKKKCNAAKRREYHDSDFDTHCTQ